MNVAGKVVVVIGGGNGIGRHVVLELLRRGARVAAVDVRQESLDETVEVAGTGAGLATFRVDITDRAAVDALGDVDGLVNVAGIIQPFVRLAELDFDVIERVIDVNLYGTLHTVKAFLPGLLERPVAHVANVSSMGGFLPVPGQTIYGASKAAVKLMTEGLYAELRETNVGVSIVFPGAVRTDITANSGVDTPGAGAAEDSKFPRTEPDAAARMIVDGIESNRLHVYVGKDSRLLNLLTRLTPKRATHLIQRQPSIHAPLRDGHTFWSCRPLDDEPRSHLMSVRATVDHDRCIGSGMCEAIAMDSFEIGDDVLSHPFDPPGDDEATLLEARDACATDAITILRDGQPVE